MQINLTLIGLLDSNLTFNFPLRTIADYFAYYFIYTYRFPIIPYAHTHNEFLKVGSKKSPQRWMQCAFCFECQMKPAVEFIYAQHYRDEKIVSSAKAFAREALDFVSSKIRSGFELNRIQKLDISRRLASTRIIIGYPEEIINSEKNEEFYENFAVNGNETYFEVCREFHKHHQKIENERKTNWKRKLDEITFKSEVEYLAVDNILCKKN